MFDTCIFGKILSEKTLEDNILSSKDEYEYFMTHIQSDELNKTPNAELRERLMDIFKKIPRNVIATESAVVDVSRIDLAKLSDGQLYSGIFEELNEKKPLQEENNIRDALIGETAIKNGITLVSCDKTLREIIKKFRGSAVDFKDFTDLMKHRN